MRSKRIVLAGLVALSAACVSLGPTVMAQTRERRVPLKTPWGDPNLQGVWNFGTLTQLERPAEWAGKAELSEEEAAKFEAQQKITQNRDLISPETGGVFYPP